jgi:ParB/RepB/Spo0J family partition protein
MENLICSIALERLLAHPDNPNRMSSANFVKLLSNIKRSGRYEPIVVREHGEREGFFQILNGHHRCRALAELGYSQADAIVWDVDDEQADILLATLNRLAGTDEPARKLALLQRLSNRIEPKQLARLLPQSCRQIKQLIAIKRPTGPVNVSAEHLARSMVFFLNDSQYQVIERALAAAELCAQKKTNAVRRAESLGRIAGYYLDGRGDAAAKTITGEAL